MPVDIEGVKAWRWIRRAPCLWPAHLPGSQKKKGGRHGKNRSGFTWYRGSRRVARQRNRQTGGKGRSQAGRARGRTGKAVAIPKAGAQIASRGSGREGQEERREKARRTEGADRQSGVNGLAEAGSR